MLFEEGPMVPPITLYSQRRLNEDAFKTVKRNTAAARRMAEIFERFGTETVEACFQSLRN